MITVTFSTPINDARRDVFLSAAQRWDSFMNTGFAPIEVNGIMISGVAIDAGVSPIDGEGAVLGQAGPTALLPESGLPATGIMQFDTADIERLEAEGSFSDVILHEMAHVLGFGTLWNANNLLSGQGTNNPRFTGPNATREYGKLVAGAEVGNPVPVANTGGAGTREGHWRELVFGDELLTGFLSGNHRPISRMSVAAFEDLGYEVDYSRADNFTLPTFLELAQMGITEAVRICDLCAVDRPKPIVLPRR